MAPEQARDARQADVRSDIYSLGCTFFFMLVGKPPFPDGSALQKLLQHQSGEPPNLAQLRPDVPESVVEVLDTMLAKRPEDRFQNPAELLAALIAVTEQLGIVYPQISLPSAGRRARDGANLVSPPRRLAGAGRVALALGAHTWDRVASPAAAASVSGTAHGKHGAAERQTIEPSPDPAISSPAPDTPP